MPSSKAFQMFFMQEIAGDTYLEAQLLLMTVATGCLDVMTFTTYNVFTSKQTGKNGYYSITDAARDAIHWSDNRLLTIIVQAIRYSWLSMH